MMLDFRFQPVRVGRPIVTVGGRWVRPMPLVPVTIIGPNDSRARTALLDTGADDTVFPESLAAILGIDLSNAPTGHAIGVGMQPGLLRYAEAQLRLVDGRNFCEWTAMVGFTATPMRFPLLGFAGFLQFFTATFHGDRERVELTPNALFPGP